MFRYLVYKKNILNYPILAVVPAYDASDNIGVGYYKKFKQLQLEAAIMVTSFPFSLGIEISIMKLC